MLSVDELCSLIDREVRPLPSVRLPLAQALGHYLAEEIRADADMPAFDRAAIDGYALPENALPGWYKVVGEVTPGMPPFAAPTSGTAVKIFTGSALPGSGVGLVMVEETESEGQKVLTRVAASDRHVRAKGSQAKRGATVIGGGDQSQSGRHRTARFGGSYEPSRFKHAKNHASGDGKRIGRSRSRSAGRLYSR